MKKTKIVFTIVVSILVSLLVCSCSTVDNYYDFDVGVIASKQIIEPVSNDISVIPVLKNSLYALDDQTHTIHFYDYGFISPVINDGFKGISVSDVLGVALDLSFSNSELMIGPGLSFSSTVYFNPFDAASGFGISLFADYKYLFNEKYFLNLLVDFDNLGSLNAFVGVGIRKIKEAY